MIVAFAFFSTSCVQSTIPSLSCSQSAVSYTLSYPLIRSVHIKEAFHTLLNQKANKRNITNISKPLDYGPQSTA